MYQRFRLTPCRSIAGRFWTPLAHIHIIQVITCNKQAITPTLRRSALIILILCLNTGYRCVRDCAEDSKPSTQVPSHDIDDEENSLESPLAEASQPQVNGIASAFSGLTSSSSTNATWEPRPLQQHMKPAGSPTLPTVLSIANLPVSIRLHENFT